MPPTAPTVVIPVYSPSTPTAPAAVTAAQGASSPAAPVVVVAQPSGSAPTAPGAAQPVHDARSPAGSPLAAALETALAGSNNDIKWTASAAGWGGNMISVEYAAANEELPAVNAAGNEVSINLAPIFAVAITGVESPTSANRMLYYAGLYEGNPHWTNTGKTTAYNAILYYYEGKYYYASAESGPPNYRAEVTAAVEDFAAVMPMTATLGTGNSSATAGPPTASAVIAAAALDADAARLVSGANKTANNGSGTVIAMARTNLTGGRGVTAPETVMAAHTPSAPAAPSAVQP